MTRTGRIGSCYEYRADGARLSGTDRMTIDGLVALSRSWPQTYHQYVATDGYVTWAHGGREIAPSALPRALRD